MLTVETVRVMRILVAMRIFEETEGQRTYKSLPLANAFVDGSPWADAMTHLFVSFYYSLPHLAFHFPNVPFANFH